MRLARLAVVACVVAVIGCSYVAKRQKPDTAQASPPVSVAAAAGRASATKWSVAVDAGKVIGEANPLVFGQNIEAGDPQCIFGATSNPVPGRTGDGVWDPAGRRATPELVAAAKELGVGMMRYPGGCLSHNFDWKKTIGPVESRPNFTFGLDEFMRYCEAIDAEPLVTVSAYVGSPRDAADLVEYLNAPAVAAHPWAMRRAANGRRDRYGVVYFEMGNESDHGNHQVVPLRKHTAETYAQWVNECSRLMRAVDRGIWIGAHLGTGTGPEDPWNASVLKRAHAAIDYVVIHTYAVGLWKGDPPDVDRAARAALAAVRPFERMLAQYRDVIFESTGRDLPLAVTEYNAAYVQEQPVPLRFSLAAALFSADYVRVMLQPESRVAMANYWQFVNGYWGILRGQRVPGVEAVPWKRMPAYYIFRLWGNHFGNRLVATGVVSPPVEFEGFLRTRPARAGSYERELSFNLRDGEGSSYRWRVTGERSMELSIDGLRGGAYPEFARILPMQGRMIRVSFEARASGAVPATAKLGIGVVDARGWSTVPWGVGIDSIRVTREWERHAAELLVLDDSPGVSLTWRVISEEVAVTGRVDLRDLRAIEVKDDPPFDALTACASLSADGRTVYVVVINKHHAEDVAARVTVGGRRLAGCRVWEVTGPSLAATNLVDEQVRETKTAAPVTLSTGRGFEYVFPRHSMSAFEFVVAQ